MSRASFALQYEGAAVDSGLMSVRDLAPALLALGNLCDQINRDVNGDRASVEVKIKTFAPGSFIVDLLVGVTVLNAIFGPSVKNANDLLDFINKLVELTKNLKKRKVEDATEIGDGITRLIVEHTQVIDVSDRLYGLMAKRGVQQDLARIVAPLKTEGIDRVKILKNHHVIETVERADIDSFEALPSILPGPEETIIEQTSTIEKYYKVVTLSNNPKQYWKLSDGSSEIAVSVADSSLHDLAKEGGLGIEPGFVVKARIKSETRFENGEPKTKNYLEKILDVKRPPQHDAEQLPF